MLVSFAPAGGTSSTFSQWSAPGVELVAVRFPGRSVRSREPAIESMETLVTEIGQAVGPALPKHYYVLGVCLGGIIAYEFTRWLSNRGFATPARLFVSGCGAPSTPFVEKSAADLGDAELVERLRKWGGTSDEVLASAEMVGLMLPPLRADLRMLTKYVHSPSPVISTPITAFRGSSDHELDAKEVDGWAQCTTAKFRTVELEGGHFVKPSLLMDAIVGEMKLDR